MKSRYGCEVEGCYNDPVWLRQYYTESALEALLIIKVLAKQRKWAALERVLRGLRLDIEALSELAAK